MLIEKDSLPFDQRRMLTFPAQHVVVRTILHPATSKERKHECRHENIR